MTAHIIFSALDAENPATLSPVILGDVLRGEFGFQGVIMSDSMNMHSIKKNYESADAIVRAFQAGVDLLMLAEEHYDHNAETYLQEQTGLIRAVKRAVENGDLPMQRVDESVRRVLALKAKYNLSLTPPLNVASVGSPANRAVELQVSRHAVAVMRDVHGHVPLDRSQPLTLVNTTTRSGYAILSHTRGIGPNQTTAAFDTVAEALLAQCPQAQVVTAEEMLKAGIAALGGEGVIVAVTENYALPGVDFVQDSQRQIIKKLVATVAERLVVVALRDPYELADLPELPTYVCAFSFRPCAAQAAVEALLGDIQVVGVTPVGIPNTNFSAKD
jgi:beta-N-acetylhexosaminidase